MNFSNLFKFVSRLPLNRVRAERGADVRGGGVTTGEFLCGRKGIISARGGKRGQVMSERVRMTLGSGWLVCLH